MVHATLLVSVLLVSAAVVSAELDPNQVLTNIIKELRTAPEGAAGQAIYNKACDSLLTNINNEIIRQGHAIVPLPDIDQGFDQSIAGVAVKGNVHAELGRVANLATLKRISNTNLKKSADGNRIDVAVIVTLGSFSVQYQKYTSDINGGKNEGRIDVFVKNYAASFQVAVQINGHECSIELEKFKIKTLEGISVVVVPTNPMLMAYLNWYMENEKGNRIKELEEKLVEQGKAALKQFKCSLSL